MRFTYGVPPRASWGFFNQVSAGFGFYFDDLIFTNLVEVSNTRFTALQSIDTYAVPVRTSGVSLRMRASYFPDLWSDWGVRLDAFVSDSDGDGVADAQDAFPFDPAASIDSDGDGYPDSWNVNATPLQIAVSTLQLDVFPSDASRWQLGGLPAIQPPVALTVASVDGYALPVSFPAIQAFLGGASIV